MAVALVHVEANHGDETRTIPLAAHTGAGRTAVVITSWQGAAHGSADMGATPAVFTEHYRAARPADFTPAMAVWSTTDLSANVDLPITHGGCGFVLWVVTDLDTVTVSDTSSGFGLSYGVAGAGDEFTVAAVATNGQKTVAQSGGLTLTAPPPYFSEPVGGHATPGVTGSFTWPAAETQYAGVTVELASPSVTYTWTNDADTIVSGTQVGAGLGVDVTSTDTDGITATAGSTLEVVDQWTVSPAGPPSIGSWQTRATLPADYDPTKGYAVEYQLEDGSANVLIAWTTYPPLIGTDAGIAGGETKVFDTGQLSGLVWPDGGADPQLRIRFTETDLATLRPAGGAAGRLARPRMVELWRSQGETVGGPSLTVPDRWVDPINGSDGNDGLTEGNAWRTMQHAFAQTDGLGIGIGYKSGTITTPFDLSNGVGGGTSFHDRMNTHYVLDGHEVLLKADWRFAYAFKVANDSYIQLSGFTAESTVNDLGGLVDGSYGLHAQDYDDVGNDCHHWIFADCKGINFTGSGISGYGTTYVRMLGCEIYDCGWWHASGGSGTTWNDSDRSPTDTTPAGYVNGQPINIWIQSCYVTGSRQKTDSYNINPDVNGRFPGGYNVTTDGNAFAIDYAHLGGETVRVAMVNCIGHNSGGKSFNSYQGADEWWVINCLGAYGGRHIEYTQQPGDPIQGMNPTGQLDFVAQSYASASGKPTTVHYWNNAAVAGSWMTNSQAFGTWDGSVTMTVDAQNNKRTATYQSDSYSTVMTDPLFVDGSLDGTLFDPRPQAGSPLLTGGNLALLALCTDDQGNQVTTDFAGSPVNAIGNGHVGPYAVNASDLPTAPLNVTATPLSAPTVPLNVTATPL